MRKLIIATLAILATVVSISLPDVANAKGLFNVVCAPSHMSDADPIKETASAHAPNPYGVPGHTFFGNKSTVATSTVPSLQAGESTCELKSLNVAFWVPTMVSPSGQAVMPKANTEYRFDDIRQGPSLPRPQGLAFIFGSAMNTNPNATATLWACTGVASTATMTIPTSCPAGATGIHSATYPWHGCWNGTQLGAGLYRGDGPADFASHINLAPACTNGVYVPRISIVLKYPLEAIGGRMSCDPTTSPGGVCFHIDEAFVSGKDAMGRDFSQTTTDMCLNFVPDDNTGNAGTTCRVVTNAAGQKELRRISDNALVVDGGVSAPQPPPPSSGFNDPFDGSTLDTAKWDVVSGTPTVAGGLCHLGNGDAIGTKVPFQLTGKTATAYGWGMRQMLLRDTAYAGNAIDLKRIGGNLVTYSPNGAPQQTIPYDPVAHANLRIREASGTVYWEASPDGTSWNTLRSFPTPSWVASRDATLRFLGASTSEAALDSTIDRVTLTGVAS